MISSLLTSNTPASAFTPVEPYRGIPPLAGLADFSSAVRPGLSVEECVTRLKRFHYMMKRLAEVFTAHVADEPVYELKMAFSLHAHLFAEHVGALRNRVAEMREPPLGLDKTPHTGLAVLMDEILATESTFERLSAIYGLVMPALEEAITKYTAETHPLADHPSIRILRYVLLDLADVRKFGEQAVSAFQSKTADEESTDWMRLLDVAIIAAGGIDGSAGTKSDGDIHRHYSSSGYRYNPAPKRDERFQDLDNQGVNPEVFLHEDNRPLDAKVLMLYFKRIREIDVPEMIASIVIQDGAKHPWDYSRDLIRQMWDEARHAMMGEVGFRDLGLNWAELTRINHTFSLNLNTRIGPKERHAVLYFIEQGLMPKTGKRFEWEVATQSEVPLAATFQDFDWADEVLHARIGRTWLLPQFSSTEEALKVGEEEMWKQLRNCYNESLAAGKTNHENWWPTYYSAYCQKYGKMPDPEALAYNRSYQPGGVEVEDVIPTSA
jgi:hypothetical protein